MAEVPHVALLVETSREYARGLLRGVARYHRENGPWSIYFEAHGLDAPPPAWLKNWRGDGILVRVDNRKMAGAIEATGIPAVDVRGAFPDLGLPFIGVDNHPIAELAFRHLADCGRRSFAFCGTPRGENPNQDLRCDLFVQIVEEAGAGPCHVYAGASLRNSRENWESSQQKLAKWLSKLPKPVGVMACHDDCGRQVLDACRRAGLHVPNDVAVIGVDNDPFLCNLCTPPLSSIDINPARIGYEAAALLDRLMKGESPPEKPILLGPPRGVAARLSTDTLSIEDQEIANAIAFIRDNAVRGITSREVVARAEKSPSTLERRIKRVLGRSIKGEIMRVRLMRAKLLLCETELPVARIAERTGFSEAKYFCEVFRKREGMTATDYRKQFRDQME